LEVLVVDHGLPHGERRGALPDAPSAPARLLFYTSGTTSDPKGARHTDAALVAASRSFTTALDVRATDVLTLLAPVAHVGGLTYLVTALRTGCRLVVSDTFDAERTPAFLRRHAPTLIGSGVPFIRAYQAYQRSHGDEGLLFPEARAFLCGGSARPPGLQDEVRSELGGVGVVSGYGLTECPHLSWASIGDSDADRAATEGRPAEGVEVVVVDGELRVKAPQLTTGYVDASLDAEAFDADGYFRTGDLGQVDERGYITITGRLKDVIIRNMENISGREVEDAILTHPAVADVAAVGLPDPDTGERVCAVIVPADPAATPPTLTELCDHLARVGLNRRKHPERLEVAGALPRNAMGKVMKQELRRQLLVEQPADRRLP
jgi:acyl-CoA synthetase (AMP-forming)/AMP-acid ligase II